VETTHRGRAWEATNIERRLYRDHE
jgi:hypothetical protein